MDKKRIPLTEDGTKVYQPRQIVPVYEEYVVDNNVFNTVSKQEQDTDAALTRKWVNENHK